MKSDDQSTPQGIPNASCTSASTEAGVQEHSDEQLIQLKTPGICRRAGLSTSEHDFVANGLRTHLWLQRDSFDPSRPNADRQKFVNYILDKRGISIVRDEHAQKRTRSREEFSLDAVREPPPEVARDTDEQRDLAMDMRALFESLPTTLQEVAKALVEGRLTELGNRDGWSRRLVDERRAMLVRACRDAGLDAYL